MANPRTMYRKHFFINRTLQGRYMITFLIPMLILLAFMLFTLYVAAQTIVATTTTTIKEHVEDMVAVRFQDVVDPDVARYEGLVADIKEYVKKFSGDQRYRRAVLLSLMWVFGAGLLLVIIQITLLTIFFSHKLAGPVFRFERVCHGLIEGNYAQKIVLRKGDDLQNLADLLNQAIEVTRERIRSVAQAATADERAGILKDIVLQENGKTTQS